MSNPQIDLAAELSVYLNENVETDISDLDVLGALASLGLALIDLDGVENPSAAAYFERLGAASS